MTYRNQICPFLLTIFIENELVLSNLRSGVFLHEPHVIQDAGEAPPDGPLIPAEVPRPAKGTLARGIGVHDEGSLIRAWQFQAHFAGRSTFHHGYLDVEVCYLVLQGDSSNQAALGEDCLFGKM